MSTSPTIEEQVDPEKGIVSYEEHRPSSTQIANCSQTCEGNGSEPVRFFGGNLQWLQKRLGRSVSENKPGPYEESQRKLEDCAEGYPRLAAYLASSLDYLQFRDFSYLRTRILLEQQQILEDLEAELDMLDKADMQGGPATQQYLRNRYKDTIRQDQNPRPQRTRSRVLSEISSQLEKYDKSLASTRSIRAYGRPSRRAYESVRHWFADNEPLEEKESKFIQQREELVSLRLGDSPTFEGRIEYLLCRLDSRLIRYLFCKDAQRGKTSNTYVVYYDMGRVRILVNIIIVIVISILLVLPVVVLYQLTAENSANTSGGGSGQQAPSLSTPSSLGALLVLILFTILFCGVMAQMTSANRQELFAASAAYCAILVVFIGNLSGESN